MPRTPLPFPARQLVKLQLERGGAALSGLKLTPQELFGCAGISAVMVGG
jgi:hypothetical protein